MMPTSSHSATTTLLASASKPSHLTKPFSRLFRRSPPTSQPTTTAPNTTNTNTITTMPSPQPNQPLQIIELFQSQSCSSCHPTNALLLKHLSSSAQAPTSTNSQLYSNTLLLDYHVTYWNHLSHIDPYSSTIFDARQRDYVSRLKLRSAFTPQVIANGVASGVGGSESSLGSLVKEGKRGVGEEDARGAVEVRLEEGKGDGAAVVVDAKGVEGVQWQLEVWVVEYDPQVVETDVRKGENAGRRLRHANVVKGLEMMGRVRVGEEGRFVLGEGKGGLKRVVLVQDGRGGRVVGATLVD